ncbi:MAG: hypothetical protein HWD92_08825 [Flavobacteriia bacterium]|nr:hypothetical protein [Flavobacteriia bacterium]
MRFNTSLFVEFVKASDYTQREFAEKYQMSYMRLRRILEGESQLDVQQLADICRDSGLSMYHFYIQDQKDAPVPESNPLLYGQKHVFNTMKRYLEENWKTSDSSEEKAKSKVLQDISAFI